MIQIKKNFGTKVSYFWGKLNDDLEVDLEVDFQGLLHFFK